MSFLVSYIKALIAACKQKKNCFDFFQSSSFFNGCYVFFTSNQHFFLQI